MIVSRDGFVELQLTLFKGQMSTLVHAYVMCSVLLPVEAAEVDQKGFEMCFSSP